MAKTKTLQTNFSAGELDPGVGMRQDTEQYQNGARSLHNRRCLIAGGTRRRPGSLRQPDLSGPSRQVRWTVNRTTQYVVAFRAGAVSFYSRNATTGVLTAAGSLASCPWTGDIWREMGVVQAANTMFITHATMGLKVITRTGAATWVLSDFDYFIGPYNRPEQPYVKFAPPTMTLTPSAASGNITLTVSGADAWFTADHVGTYVRYIKRACLITAVAPDGLSCSATVIETLPETYRLTVSSINVSPPTKYFAVGQVVEGDPSGFRGIVTSIVDDTHIDVVLIEKLEPPDTDLLIGPDDSVPIEGVATTTNAGVVDWDEQMFSPVWGYPAVVELHRNRLLFGGHPNAADHLVGSALNNFYDFNIGTGADAEAFIESIGDDAASRIVQMISAEQLIVCTDTGPYYVPEGSSNPFRPTSIAFYPFGSPWPLTPTIKPEAFDGGVLMVAGSLVIKARPTGDANSAWGADEVSLLAAHLFKTPTEMTTITGTSGGGERYAIVRNTDGTLAVLQLVEAQKIRNATPHETDRANETCDSILGIENSLYIHCTRQIAGATVYTLELSDPNITLDCAVQLDALADVPTHFGTEEVHVLTTGGTYLGTYPVANPPAGPYIVGLYFTSEIETFPPVIEDSEGSHAGDMMRIAEAYVHVRGAAAFQANGYDIIAYASEATTPLNGPQRFQFLGWVREPTIPITQSDPVPLEIQAIKSVVLY